jgi:hypothetical protein
MCTAQATPNLSGALALLFKMHIYLSHPVHGAKVAISDMEVEYDEGNGWMRYNPETPSVEIAAETAESFIPSFLEPVNHLKRGRPRKAAN